MSLIHLSLLLYCALILLAIIAWINYKVESKEAAEKNAEENYGITIIVPFRDEAIHLPSLFNSIRSQKTDCKWEIILVDDHSSDGSLDLAKQFESDMLNVKVLELKDGSGKKNAIRLGIEAASYEIIIQTDADCFAGTLWLESMNRNFDSNTGMLLGPIKISESGKSWDWFNQIEAAILQGLTAAACYYRYPLMANGANMMYRKSDYLAYENSGLGKLYLSGDDQFLLEFLSENKDQQIKFNKNRDAIVQTTLTDNWKEMVSQRARWAGKNKRWTGWRSILHLTLGLPQFGFVLLLCMGIFNSAFFGIALNFLLVKTCFEFALFYVVADFFQYKIARFIPVFALLYPVFLIQVFLAGNQTVKWKDRPIK